MELIAFLARTLLHDLLFCVVFFRVGWIFLKLCTLGRYPRSKDRATMDWWDLQFISFCGLAALVLGGCLLAKAQEAWFEQFG